ncbi:hypothetical protein R5R35_009912 [Gryllus longicercus]|uniref:Uncharacterized protein n=1 Tax=Gryllus longicercus TaxID=2509291 RepID=A0AAN9W1W5_9ORTH
MAELRHRTSAAAAAAERSLPWESRLTSAQLLWRWRRRRRRAVSRPRRNLLAELDQSVTWKREGSTTERWGSGHQLMSLQCL